MLSGEGKGPINMQNYGRSNSSTLLKGALLIVGLFILIFVAQKIMAIVVTILTLAALVIGIWLIIKYLSRNSRRY